MADEPVLTDMTLIEPIELDDAHGHWVFEPKADITPLEAVLIAHMFGAIAIRHLHGKHNRWDWREYLTREHLPITDAMSDVNAIRIDLARHFRQEDW